MSLTIISRPPDTENGPAPVQDPRPTKQSFQLREILALAAAVFAGLAVVFLVGPRLIGAATPHFYAGTVLQQSTPAPTLDALELGEGGSVDLAAFEGDVVLLYFGYTSCPDVCPTTMIDASRAIDDLSAEDAARVRLLMVSVDPARDDPAVVDDYAKSFHSSFMGASGEEADVYDAATRYGIFYEVNEPYDPATSDNYFVDHTSTLMAVDTAGTLRVVWSPTVTSDEISGDVQALLDQ